MGIDLSSAAAQRLNGVSPLYVCFDASEVTSTNVSKPFHQIFYEWDFDSTDEQAWGTWDYGNPYVNSRKKAYGPVVGCTFEIEEGGGDKTFTVTLDTNDGTDTASTSFTITVYDPVGANGYGPTSGGNHYYFSPTGDFSDVPADVPTGNTIIESELSNIVSNYLDTGRRLLLQAGGEFTAASYGRLNIDGPWTIGSYGETGSPGSRPRVSVSYAFALLISSPSTPNIKDGRIMDILFIGDGTTGTTAINDGHGTGTQGGSMDQLTFLRLGFRVLGTSIATRAALVALSLSGHHIWKEWCIQDTDTYSIAAYGAYGHYPDGLHLSSILGNFVWMYPTLPAQGHGIRSWFQYKTNIGHNLVYGPHQDHCLKIHGPTKESLDGNSLIGIAPSQIYTLNGGYTQKVVISDNCWFGQEDTVWNVGLAPQDLLNDERLKEILVDRDWFTVNRTTNEVRGIIIACVEDYVVRNCLFNMTQSNNATNVGVYAYPRGLVTQSPSTPQDDQGEIYNNTFYYGVAQDINDDNSATEFDAHTKSANIRNNLFYTLATGHVYGVVRDISGGDAILTQDHNTGDSGISGDYSTDPNFLMAVAGDGSDPGDFRIDETSYAYKAGSADYPWNLLTYDGQTRDATNPSLGAFDEAVTSSFNPALALAANPQGVGP